MEAKRYLVVGAGWAGSTIARKLAEDGSKVLVVDRNGYVAGHAHDKPSEKYGIMTHVFGPHIFHTYKEKVFQFVSQFGDFFYEQPVISVFIEETGKTYKTPFNFELLDDLSPSPEATKKALLEAFPGRERVTVLELINHKDRLVSDYGKLLFKVDYQPYTAKQWGREPEEVDPTVLERVPVFMGYQEGYFEDTYVGFFKEGYTKLMENMLHHKNISVELNREISKEEIFQYNNDGWTVIYTGALDELFDYRYGHLPYRSLKMTYKESAKKDVYGEHSVIAFPRDKTVTRVTQAQRLPIIEDCEQTVLVIEEPMEHIPGKTHPYYPINNEENNNLHKKYVDLANETGIKFCGRLADYKYYNMDQVIETALKYYEEELSK